MVDIAAQHGAAPSHSFSAIVVTAAPQGAIQPKLTVGAAHDPYEDEADRVAGQVMRMADAQVDKKQTSSVSRARWHFKQPV